MLIFYFVCLIRTKTKAMLLVIIYWAISELGARWLPGNCSLTRNGVTHNITNGFNKSHTTSSLVSKLGVKLS